VQAAGPRAGELLAGAPLDDGDVDTGQGQLTRQHQSRRAAADDHHRVLVVRPSARGSVVQLDLHVVDLACAAGECVS
jgi:hypothetical protein